MQAWTNWIREDPPPFHSPNGSGILVQSFRIAAHFRKAWMPFFRREGHPVINPQDSPEFEGDHFPQSPFLDTCLFSQVKNCTKQLGCKSPQQGDWMARLDMKSMPFLSLGLLD